MRTDQHATGARRPRQAGQLRRLLNAGLTVAVTVATLLVATAAPARPASTPGVDVSNWQGAINWSAVRGSGVRFAFIKATEGTSYRDRWFGTNYVAAYQAGVIRGAYHFALPDRSSGAAQANYLAGNGGAWSADGRTLPAALDIEYNPYGPTCYGLSQIAMRNWIDDFLATYRHRTGRYAVIYTTTDWWLTCTGGYRGFWADHPLWLARWGSSPGALPPGALFWSFWQFSSTGRIPGIVGDVDRNLWYGTIDQLVALASDGPPNSCGAGHPEG